EDAARFPARKEDAARFPTVNEKRAASSFLSSFLSFSFLFFLSGGSAVTALSIIPFRRRYRHASQVGLNSFEIRNTLSAVRQNRRTRLSSEELTRHADSLCASTRSGSWNGKSSSCERC